MERKITRKIKQWIKDVDHNEYDDYLKHELVDIKYDLLLFVGEYSPALTKEEKHSISFAIEELQVYYDTVEHLLEQYEPTKY